MNRRTAALAVAVALLAAACGRDEAALVGRDAPGVEQIDCPLAVPASVACGLVTVPLDHADPSAGTTTISIATRPGGDTAVAVLQGGPGGASTDFAAWFPGQPFTQVFVDQRGTGFGAADFDCPEYDAVLPDLLELPIDRVDGASAAALTECAERVGDHELFAHTDTVTHALDIAVVMDTLGHDDWLVYGVSYGSTIGLELVRAEPDGLAGAILDGVYPPALDLDRAVPESARSSIDAITVACQDDPVCSGWSDDFAADLDDAVAQLDAEPMTVVLSGAESGFGESVSVRLDGRRFGELVFLLLYDERQIAGLPAIVAAVVDGDEAAAASLASVASRTLASAYGANHEATYFAVQCHERVPVVSGIDETLDGFVATIVTTSLADDCPVWERAAADADDVLAPIVSDLPVLLLSGEFDPITPPAYAESVADDLSASVVVAQQGRSHGVWIGNACIQAIVADFVAGTELDVGCADEPVPVNWFRPD